jgi:hypothetical protein
MGDSNMVKFKLTYNPANIDRCFKEMKDIKGLFVSHTLVERISTSGDTTGTPFYHFRWKLHNLADFVAYPENSEHVKQIIKTANKFSVSITPRGSGSCYYGSGIPANGGLVMDMKRMKSFSINKDSMTATTQPGIVFSSLMTERLLPDECLHHHDRRLDRNGWLDGHWNAASGRFYRPDRVLEGDHAHG